MEGGTNLLSSKLRAAGIAVDFRWERIRTAEQLRVERLWKEGKCSFTEYLKSTGTEVITSREESQASFARWRVRDDAKKSVLGDTRFRRLGFWLDQLPKLQDWFTLVEDVLENARETIIDFRERVGEPFAYFICLDREEHPVFFDRLRELRWERAAKGAAERGMKLPHVLEGERFSIQGHNFEVGRPGNCSLWVTLFDENDSPIGGVDIFDDPGVEPPTATPKPGGRGARANMNRALSLVGGLADHLANKVDR